MNAMIKRIYCVTFLLLALSCSQNRKEIEASEVSLVKEQVPPETGYQEMKSTMPVQANKDLAVSDEKMVQAEAEMTPSQNDVRNSISSAAAVVNKEDTKHRFIRTADLKFRAKDVTGTTYAIENIVVRQNGFVTNSSLQSATNYVKNVDISKDSILRITYYTVTSSMVLRVPDVNLDTTLKEIAPLVEYLDYRIVQASDVSLSLKANELSQKRLKRYQQRVSGAVDDKGRRLYETMDAEERLLNAGESEDNAKLANLALEDQINYSTVMITIYQNQQAKREFIEKEIELKPYEYKASFKDRFVEAIRTGWEFIQDIFILISYAWVFILIAIFAYIGYKTYSNKRKKSE